MKLTFKNFIVNEVYGIKYDKASRAETLKLTTEEIIKSIEQYSPKTIKSFKDVRIYRGVHNINVDPKYVDPTQFNRKSSSTSNFYTVIIDNSPAWSKYPKRSQSLVCSTNFEYASGYGKTYLVIPIDGVPIGVCSEDDFWGSFSNVSSNLNGHSMAEFNDHILQVLDALHRIEKLETPPIELRNTSDFNKLKKELNKLTKSNVDEVFLKINRFDDEFKDYIESNIKSMSMIELLNKLLDPEKNDFTMIKSGAKVPVNNEDKEVWVGGKSLLLPVFWPDSHAIFKHFGLLNAITSDTK